MPRPKSNKKPWNFANTVESHAYFRGAPHSQEREEARKQWRADRAARLQREQTSPGLTPARAREKRAAKDAPRTRADGKPITAIVKAPIK